MNGKWIWISAKEADSYAEFSFPFRAEKGRRISLAVACEGHFAAYIDGRLVLFSQCGAYPEAPLYDEKTVSRFFADGNEHEVKILAWHLGVNSQNYIALSPSLWFEMRENGKCVFASDAGVSCRKSMA